MDNNKNLFEVPFITNLKFKLNKRTDLLAKLNHPKFKINLDLDTLDIEMFMDYKIVLTRRDMIKLIKGGDRTFLISAQETIAKLLEALPEEPDTNE